MRRVEIDGQSGFCGGVIRAISTAEKNLESGPVYSLGAIVHNDEELSRLKRWGLVTLTGEDLLSRQFSSGESILIRAHGEPPAIYDAIRSKGLKIIDCTCPVVLKLQSDIRDAHMRLEKVGGSIVLFGKIGHPEVLGLVGQVHGDAKVVEDMDQLVSILENGSLATDHDIDLFSQTTMNPDDFRELRIFLESKMKAELRVHETICSQVASRHRQIFGFASSHDVVVFVAGKTSSNGAVLFGLCKAANPRTYGISSVDELKPEWFRPGDSIGVSGATSTPKWLLDRTVDAIRSLDNLQ